jgi:rhomboid family GlyGly-CTERM serine protease
MNAIKDKVRIAIPFLMALTAIVLYFSIDQNLFQYDSAAICNGEIWRNISGHFAHWSFSHLFWNALAFLILGCICSYRSIKDFLLIILLSSLMISFSVEIFYPEMRCYRGLSGIDSALFCYAAWSFIHDSLEDKKSFSACAGFATLALLGGKTAFEMLTGNTLFVQSTDFIPLPLAHIVGAIAGSLVFLSKFIRLECKENETLNFAQ